MSLPPLTSSGARLLAARHSLPSLGDAIGAAKSAGYANRSVDPVEAIGRVAATSHSRHDALTILRSLDPSLTREILNPGAPGDPLRSPGPQLFEPTFAGAADGRGRLADAFSDPATRAQDLAAQAAALARAQDAAPHLRAAGDRSSNRRPGFDARPGLDTLNNPAQEAVARDHPTSAQPGQLPPDALDQAVAPGRPIDRSQAYLQFSSVAADKPGIGALIDQNQHPVPGLPAAALAALVYPTIAQHLPKDVPMKATAHPNSQRLVKTLAVLTFVVVCAVLWWPRSSHAARIKEVAAVQGVRSNQLVGYGLVVGLDGTGDQTTQTPFTTQSLNAMLQQMGVAMPAGAAMQLRNVAAVMVTAQLPAFAQPGQQIDVNVSSMGNAKSLRGGTLIGTPLKGADGEIYAMAQGNLIVGGAGASQGGSKVQINHLSAGRVPAGASVERAVATPLGQGEFLQLDLNSADYTTARDVARAINNKMGAGTAQAVDGRVVRVRMPGQADARVTFLADIENIDIALASPAAKIVINARTGSVVMNQAVTLAPCSVAHGSLAVTISSTPVVSQPTPFSQGQTVVGEKTDIKISQQGGSLIQLAGGTKLSDVVNALNSLGATPQDLLAILQSMKSAGALNAELEVI